LTPPRFELPAFLPDLLAGASFDAAGSFSARRHRRTQTS
jgi:hypothetical protein